MKNKMVYMLIATCFTYMTNHPIAFTFKGGATNKIDIAIFKSRGNFETFIKHVGGSAESARAIEAFTSNKENAAIIGSVVQGVVTVGLAVGTAATGGAITPVTMLALQSLPLITAGLTFITGQLAVTAANTIRSFAQDYASHYFENIVKNQKICRGATGERLVRRIEFPLGKKEFMDFKKPQSIYLVIFNKDLVKDRENDVIAQPHEIIFAGEIRAEDIGASFDITTEEIIYYDVDDEGKPVLDEEGKQQVLQKSIVVKLKKTNPYGGMDCPIKK